ncbi:tripartite tricarboxylate transporter TctB family protein [Telmatospirillum sp. J64-1]|uniref:tripartite tricarboxylate transporter TctB family protein n=1 Tax=Telmatospirillum sp. J64-1 TaxID=2502183 RepID=UPI00115EB0FE|nr:tripartite tricarboxylate transporter TctB family protein [Telmatospirillum sp. J64-1]
MEKTQQKSRLPWGDIGFASAMAAFTLWYLFDSYHASSRTTNLVLILPVGILVLALAVGIALRPFLVGRKTAVEAAPAPTEETVADPAPVTEQAQDKPWASIGVMILFAAYICAIPFAGFDVSSAVFLAISLFQDGERRPLVLLVGPILFAAAATLAFKMIIPFPLPTLLL